MQESTVRETSPESAAYAAGMGASALRVMFRGKHWSAAVIVLTGAVLLLGGSFIGHRDTSFFVQAAGVVVGTIGLVGWVFSTSER
jgi:drug/metabolite transporter (DMT)-like permease